MSFLFTVAAPLVGRGQVVIIPERFNVIDITPNNLSGEHFQNSEPSLGLGTGAKYGDWAVHAFSGAAFPTNYYYTSDSNGDAPWINPGTMADRDGSMDWSAGGTCYLATIPKLGTIDVLRSTDPANIPFSPIPGAKYVGGQYPKIPDQPWISVVTVSNTDHIYVGFNDLTKLPGKTASVRYSLNGGATWSNFVLEKLTPGTGWDSPAVRFAISPDGKTVYALYQRASSFLGADFASDFSGDVVLMRDDAYGASGYNALGLFGTGSLVTHDAVLPWGSTSLGAQRLGSGCAVAVDPKQPSKVYVAYTEVLGSTPVLRVKSSTTGGAGFNLVYSVTNASVPHLAVTKDGTVGLLCLLKKGTDLEVHFFKALAGGFEDPNERVLAKFPNNYPIKTFDPYIGDYFALKAVNYNFYGTFCASSDPQAGHFPSLVFFQRNVKVNGILQNNFVLTSSGTLANLSGQAVAPSIDPFAFYDIAPVVWLKPPYIELIEWPRNPVPDPGDPFGGDPYMTWPALPATQPQLQLESSLWPSGPGANWAPATNNTIIQSNGEFLANILGRPAQQFYRLRQDVAGGRFNLFAAAAAHGLLSPSGIMSHAGLESQTFTAVASNNYAVSQWYLDGVPVQTGGSSLTVSNIADEHTLLVTFVASNDLAVTICGQRLDEGPALIFTTNRYEIEIENKGLNLLTGITVSNLLPANVNFVSASSSQGTVRQSGGLVTADIGSLSPGALASIIVHWMPLAVGTVTDTVSVACSQFDPFLDNNTATEITTVIEPVTIIRQPVSQTVPVGGTATFDVGVSGTPPFAYQWAFNGISIDDGTYSTLTLSNAVPAQAGSYSVTVLQILGPEEVMDAHSDAATLTVR